MGVRFFYVILLICFTLNCLEGFTGVEHVGKPDTSLSPFFSTFNAKQLNSAGLDFSPVYYGDDLVFISEKELDLINYGEARFSKLSYLAVLYSKLGTQEDKPYSTPKSFSVHINQLNHNGPISFSGDGNYAVFTRTKYEKFSIDNVYRPRLYSAVKEGEKWKYIKQLNFVGDEYFYAHPCLSENGLELYFTSDREGGFGGYDIYKCIRASDEDEWGEPTNLGGTINTGKNEVFPYFHQEGMLFFSSDGYKGNGGLDIYYSILSSAGRWLMPNHLDANINSGADDFGIIFNDNNDQGFFSSNRDGGKGKDDIYGFFVTWQNSEEKMIEINGRFSFTSLPPKNADGLNVFLIKDDESPVEFQKTDMDGYFMFKNLSGENEYQIKTEGKIQQLELELLNNDDQPVALSSDVEGKFLFRRLDYKQFDEVPFLFLSEIDPGLGMKPYKSFNGKLVGSHGKGQYIYAYNEKKEARDSVVSDQNGDFSFHQLEMDDAIYFKTNEYYQDMELWVYKNNEKIAEMVQNEKGEFVYLKLVNEIIDKMELEGTSDSRSLLDADIKGYDLKWLPSDKQKQILTGRFKYRNLPSKPVDGLEVILIDENNEVIAMTTTDNGYFLFRNLPIHNKYIVKTNTPSGILELEMLNLNTKSVAFISDDEGKFVFRRLSYKDNEELSYMFGAEIDPEAGYYTKSFSGRLTGNDIEERKVILLNNDGKEVTTTTTNSKGYFKFKSLPYSESYIVKLEELDSNISMLVYLGDEVVAEMKIDSNGHFVYIELDHATIARLGLMESSSIQMILDDEFTSYASKWVMPNKSTYAISGKFQFKKLPSKVPPRLKVHLINELDEIVQTSESDLEGGFVFQNLPYNNRYVIKIEKHTPELMLDLLDENNKAKIRLANNEEGIFIYQALTHEDLEDVGFLYGTDLNIDKPKTLSGQIKFKELPYNDVLGLNVHLINEVGEIVYTATSDLHGVFSFENLPYKDHYIIKTDQYDSNMAILILDDEKVVAELSGNRDGEFEYLKLSYKIAGQIAMMNIGKNSHLITRRGISGYGEEYVFEKAILSDDSKTAYVYSAIKPKMMDALALMQNSNLGLCPETEDLPLEELNDCIDFTIEELLANEENAEKIEATSTEDNLVGELENKTESSSDELSVMEENVEIKEAAPPQGPAEISTTTEKRFVLYFGFDSEQLIPSSELLFDELIVAIKANLNGKILINSHTDTQGGEAYNYALSSRRSIQLSKKISSYGISSVKIKTKPFGESAPIIACPKNCTEEQHKQNRRAEIILH